MKTGILRSSVVAWLGIVWLCMSILVVSADLAQAQPCGPNSIKVVKVNLTPCYWTPSGPDPYIGVEIVMYRAGGVNQRQWISPNDGANSVEYINNDGGPWNGQIYIEGVVITIPANNTGKNTTCTSIGGAPACTYPSTCSYYSSPYCPCLRICYETVNNCTTIELEEIPGPCLPPCPSC